jgi:hypothetical protein
MLDLAVASKSESGVQSAAGDACTVSCALVSAGMSLRFRL